MFENLNEKYVRELSCAISDAGVKRAHLTFYDLFPKFPAANIEAKSSIFWARMNINCRLDGLFFVLYMASVNTIALDIESNNAESIQYLMKCLVAYPLPYNLQLNFNQYVNSEAVDILSNSIKKSESLNVIKVTAVGGLNNAACLSLGVSVIANHNINFADYPGIGLYLHNAVNARSQCPREIKFNMQNSCYNQTLYSKEYVKSENTKAEVKNAIITAIDKSEAAQKVLRDMTNYQKTSCISM
ncbi:MAG: hypothetical protein ACK5WS_01140 [Alphaproteobacteria bacterium]|jgi:hypothetical protein|nr:hypothetical protein [Candidatus Jidaibacter sp.]